jgi:GNAT superfamily N-acetyltransferase
MEDLTQRPLGLADIPAAVELSSEPGWNQVPEDWRLMIETGDSFGMFDRAGKLVASGLTVPYGGRFGWISMILVTEAYRRRGLATMLMRSCMDALLSKAMTPALDATPEGRRVYLPLGFQDVYGITRLFAHSPGRLDAPAPGGMSLRRIEASDIEGVVGYDAARCGADRGHIIRHLCARLPGSAFLALRGERIVGYALARDGRICSQVGPVVAEDEAVATALTAASLASLSGPICADMVDSHTPLLEGLAAAGFVPQFPFIRMIHERSEPFDDPAHIFAIAGPELG